MSVALSLKDAVRTNKRRGPDRVLAYGKHKVGKTRFAAGAEKPIFMPIEDGIGEVDVDALPQMTSFQMVLDWLDVLEKDDHDFETVAIDNLTSLAPLVHEVTCKREGWPNIDDPGWMNGYKAAIFDWSFLIAALDRLRTKRGMQTILIAHHQIITERRPDVEEFKTFAPSLERRASALFSQWVDTILFAETETFVRNGKAITTGRQIAHTRPSPVWEAGSRGLLPETIDFTWAAYREARDDDPTKQMTEEVEQLIAQLAPDPQLEEKIRAFTKTDEQLRATISRLTQMIQEKQGETQNV